MRVDTTKLRLEWETDSDGNWVASETDDYGREIELGAYEHGFTLRSGSLYLEIDADDLQKSMEMAERMVAILDRVNELAKEPA